jgi:outer membrane protein insertion porin family
LRYTFRTDNITPLGNASPAIRLAAGSSDTSSFGYSYSYSTLDDPIKPRKGLTFVLSQDFAGFGGTLKYIRTTSTFSVRHPLIGDDWVGKFQIQGGYIEGYDGQHVRLNERFFEGGDSFRGFNLAGIGPREINVPGGQGAIGGEVYAIGTVEVRIPDFLPADYGINLSAFSDFGTLGHISGATPGLSTCGAHDIDPKFDACIKDNMAFRASAGIAIGWKSPFGPIEIDLGIPFIRESYDKSQIIRFSAGTGL